MKTEERKDRKASKQGAGTGSAGEQKARKAEKTQKTEKTRKTADGKKKPEKREKQNRQKKRNEKKRNGQRKAIPWIICAAVVFAALALAYLILTDAFGKRSVISYRHAEDLPFREEVRAASEKYGVEEARIYAVIQIESSFDPEARSGAGALGLMQMLPSTYEEECAKAGAFYDPEDLKKPSVSIPVCTSYLAQLHEMTGSWSWAHVAYYAGIGNVLKWKEAGLSPKDIPNEKARTYLTRIESAYDAYFTVLKETRSP